PSSPCSLHRARRLGQDGAGSHATSSRGTYFASAFMSVGAAPSEAALIYLASWRLSQLRSMERELSAQARRLETVIDNLSQGVCYFDSEERLILSNRRYAEIYRLAPEHVRPGATLTEIIERRAAVGTSSMATDACLALARSIQSSAMLG